jgi:protein involved in polysaccharide export with SLBB domain
MEPNGERMRMSLMAPVICLLLAAAVPAVTQPADMPLTPTPTERPLAALPSASSGSLDGPVDRDAYIVGPGDIFTLALWGEINMAVPVTVTPEGEIVLPAGGTLHVAGLSIRRAEEAVRERLDHLYHDVEMTLTLVVPRQLTVHVTGAVAKPGQYDATAAMRVSHVVDMAGGLVEHASERNIVLRRFDGSETRVDLVRYRNLGDLAMNPMVAEGSVVQVPFVQRSASLFGGVNLPGPYELADGDDLVGLLALAGGLRPDANLSDIEVMRFSAEDPKAFTTFAVDLARPVPGAHGPDVTI